MKAALISFIVCETAKPKKGKVEATPQFVQKSAPHYYEASVPSQFLISQEKLTLFNREGTLILKAYEPDILIAEVRFDVVDIFADDIFELKEEALSRCRDFLKKKGGKNVERFSEEYSVFSVSDYKGDPELFLKYGGKIASLLKSEKLALDEREIEYTLESQLKYAQNDLVIVDWDGAFIFDPEGDIEATVELLELANLQLLRYRLLDNGLDERLHGVARLIEQAPVKTKFLFKAMEVSQAMKDTMRIRSISISEFQDLEREMKLIGDWYSARLYELASKKMKIDEWRKNVKEKLDALEDVYAIASENFTVSWERRSRIIEMIGWYVLLIGWLVLLVLDIYFYKK
ncbi:MAG TPA: hypothetical protein VJK04_02445 [Candidatus Paceibacterota bacterium]